jgi:hypothetical protein
MSTPGWTEDALGYWHFSPEPRLRATVRFAPKLGVWWCDTAWQCTPDQWVGRGCPNWEDMTTREQAMAWCEATLADLRTVMAESDRWFEQGGRHARQVTHGT